MDPRLGFSHPLTSQTRKSLGGLLLALMMAVSTLGIALPAQAAAPICSTPTISPTTKLVGDVVTASVTCSNSPTSYSYQWSSSANNSTFSTISGATQSSLTITSDLGGYYIRVAVQATNGDGTSSLVNSASLGRIFFPSSLFAGQAGDTSYLDADGTAARLGRIADMTTDGNNLFFTDYQNNRIRKITPSGTVTTVAGDGQYLSVDGTGLGASFKEPRSITYEPATNSLLITELGAVRILNLSTNQVTTMRNRATPISYSQSGTTVTLVFSADTGIRSGSTIEVLGVDGLLDGTRVTNYYSTTEIRFTAPQSRTIASTPLNGASVETNMASGQTWANFYSASEVSPDGRYYLGRGNSGETANLSYLLRMTRVSGDVFRYEKLFSTSLAPCDISFQDASTLFIQTCGAIIKVTTTDDWATQTVSAVRSSVNEGTQLLPDGLLYAGNSRTDLTSSTTVQYWAGTVADDLKVAIGDNLYVADGYDEVIYKISGLSFGDSTAPTLASSTPANGASSVSTTAPITLTFSENVFAAAGKNITLVNESDASLNIVIAATDSAVAVSSNTVTITPPAALEESTRYHVLIDSGSFADAASNLYAGISSTTALVFDTVGIPPTLTSSNPANGASSVSTSTSITLTFSESVSAAAGKNITLVNESDASLNIVIAANGSAVAVSSNTVTITPPAALEESTRYHVLIDSGSFTDAASNLFAGISSTTALVFDTAAAGQSSPQTQVPYTGPSLDASRLSARAGELVTIRGSRLGGITRVSVTGLVLDLVNVTSDSISFRLPLDTELGLHNLQLSGSFGTLTVQDAIDVEGASSIALDSDVNFCKEQSDGTFKMYALDPIGAGKIQFMVNGKEIAWVRALDSEDPKLRAGSSSHYFVRTVELNSGMQSLLEIRIAGETVWSSTVSR